MAENWNSNSEEAAGAHLRWKRLNERSNERPNEQVNQTDSNN